MACIEYDGVADGFVGGATQEGRAAFAQGQLTLRVAGMSQWVEHASDPFSSVYYTRLVDCALEDPYLDQVGESRQLRRGARGGGGRQLGGKSTIFSAPLSKEASLWQSHHPSPFLDALSAFTGPAACRVPERAMWRARLGEPSGSRCPILTKAAAGPQANLCFNARQAVWTYFPRLFHISLFIAHVETGSVLLSRWVEEGWEKVKEEEEKIGRRHRIRSAAMTRRERWPKKQPLGREMRLSAGFPGVQQQLESSKARRRAPRWSDWMPLAAMRLHTSCWPGRA